MHHRATSNTLCLPAGTPEPSGRSSLSARRRRFCCFRCLVTCRSGTASGKWTPRSKPELCGIPRSICAEPPERRAHGFARLDLARRFLGKSFLSKSFLSKSFLSKPFQLSFNCIGRVSDLPHRFRKAFLRYIEFVGPVLNFMRLKQADSASILRAPIGEIIWHAFSPSGPTRWRVGKFPV